MVLGVIQFTNSGLLRLDQYLKDHEVTLAHDKRLCNEGKYVLPFLGALPTVMLIMGGWSLTWPKESSNDRPSPNEVKHD